MNAINQRFKILSFQNRAGSRSFRVTGTKRDGTRIRENYTVEQEARARHLALESEFFKREGDFSADLRATRLSEKQLVVAELALARLTDDADLIRAVDHWLRQGKPGPVVESPRVDDAVTDYLAWLEASPFRDATKSHWKTRMTVFKNSVSNLPVADFTPDHIAAFLANRKTSHAGKDTDRRAVSRFFSWCIEKKWTAVNPARKQTRERKPESKPPTVLTVTQCRALLNSSARAGLAPYVAVCLFAGLRPFEAARLTWAAVNLKDGEIRLESNQTKTRKARVIAICNTLAAWLEAHEGKEFFPANWRKKFDAVRKAAKITDWPADVMRHTAASHYFRKTGSYGQTAEQFGNSEAIIKAHYQGRVSSDETKKFYAIKPAAKKGKK